MKTSKVIACILMSGIFLSYLLATEAKAEQEIALFNYTREKCWAAFIYKNYNGEWTARGWWDAEPGQKKTVKFPSNNSNVYTYSYCGKRTWTGQGMKGSINQIIVSSKFTIRHGESPAGKNPRKVSFRKRTTENDWMEVTWR